MCVPGDPMCQDLKKQPARAIEHDFIIYFLKKMDDLSSMPFFFKK
jgi:hypothetical protein